MSCYFIGFTDHYEYFLSRCKHKHDSKRNGDLLHGGAGVDENAVHAVQFVLDRIIRGARIVNQIAQFFVHFGDSLFQVIGIQDFVEKYHIPVGITDNYGIIIVLHAPVIRIPDAYFCLFVHQLRSIKQPHSR